MTTVRTRQLAGLLFMLLLMLGVCPAASAQSGVAAGTTVSGTVRVYLSSIASNTSVDLTINGSYSIGGDTSRAIARGARLKVQNSGGTLLMSMDGQQQTMGSRFKLRRHQTDGENGVYIAQARYPGSLYPGDIEFIARGGNVQVIVHVFMEDYMRGVLPYEMDNSFPLEALKAQAVAARTYALKKMSQQAATYDVVDTTSDQVYNGTPSGNDRCRQAVEETQGIVGTVNGEYMASYYTASNGGQTESVANAWGSGSYAYLQVKDDPYDLRNGASVAKSVTFNRDGTTSVSALTELLRTEAAALVGAGSVNIEAITSVTPHTPKYDAPSRVYKKVDVGMRLTGYGDVTVTLDYFSQVEGLCSMSINVLKNETLSVTETVGGFRLTARRFGHGVGMSQRGAQQMAAEGMTYDQILEFYYPGLVRTRYTMTRTLLPAIDGTQTQPEEPVADAKTAVVTLNNPLDSLNLRKEMSTSSAILATMPHGTQITLLSAQGEWSRVQYGTLSGYVKSEYISVQGDAVEETPPAAVSRGTATVALSDESQTLNLRAAPTLGAAVISQLRHGQTLTVLERYESWTYVQLGSLTGYVMNDYIVYDAEGESGARPEETPPAQTGSLTATVRLQSADSRLNVREQKSLSARVLVRLASGTAVTVTEWGEEWCLVETQGVSGYCATAYLRFDGETQAPEESPAPDEPQTPDASTGGAQNAEKIAIVLPSDGLNLRAAPSRDSGVIMTLPQGTMLTLTGEAVSGMLPVRLGSLAGYVAGEYVYVTEQAVVTPEPTQTPAPFAEYRVTVVAEGGLKLRQRPSTSAETLTTMPLGASATVTGEAADGFLPVRYGEWEGYASAQYLTKGEAATPIPVQTAAPTPVPAASKPVEGKNATVSAPSGLNLRAEASGSSGVLATLGYGVSVTVTGGEQNGFYPVRVGTLSGYVSADYVSFGEASVSSPAPTVTPAPQAVPDGKTYRVAVDSSNGLKLRARPDTSADVLYVLPYGLVLNVLGEGENGFLHVQWAEYEGYVSGQYVTPFGTQSGE